MNTQDIEQKVVELGLSASRVTAADIERNIDSIEIVKHISRTGKVLRWAVITTKNGYAVTGDPSCSVSPANDNADLGEAVAISNAKQAMWPLMGYALQEKMQESNKPQD